MYALSITQSHSLIALCISSPLAKIPRRPSPATAAVYQVIIVWLQRFIICTDWVTTDAKGQASLTRCSRNIFPRRLQRCRVCPPSRLKGLIANAFVWGRGDPLPSPPSPTEEYQCDGKRRRTLGSSLGPRPIILIAIKHTSNALIKPFWTIRTWLASSGFTYQYRLQLKCNQPLHLV